jgi:hypothetical protein
MSKITELLSKAVGDNADVKEISEAIEAELESAKTGLEADFNTKLEEAYKELSTELKTAEETAEKGYQEAFGVIQDLRNRLETQRAEFDAALEEGYEEAYQMLLSERGKKDSVETDLYSEYDKKLKEMKEYMIDKVDEFLQVKGKDIYEQARRDVLNDPRMAEHKVALNKVVETVSEYISDEDYALATGAKLQETNKALDELRGQVRLLEARNIRISTENNKLTEAVRQNQELLKEHTAGSTAQDAKARKEAAKNVTGRGSQATGATEVIKETTDDKAAAAAKSAVEDNTLVESLSADEWATMKTLSGIKTHDKK